MRGIVDKIMTFHEIRAKALSVLVANTEKALEEFAPDREKTADEQTAKLDIFVKDLTRDVNNMLTRFWFQKERKLRHHEQMTDDEVKNLADFVNFTKTLTKDVRSLLTRFQKVRSQMFEEKIDKEMQELEIHVRRRLKEFDEALSETPDTLTNRLSKYAGNIAAGIRGRLKTMALAWYRRMWIRENMRTTRTFDSKINLDVSSGLTKPLTHSIKQDSITESIDPQDSRLEALFDGPNMININEANSNSEKSKRQIHLKV